MWLARTCSWRLVLRNVGVVVALDVGCRHGDLQPRLIAIDQEVLDRALLAHTVGVLVGLVVRVHVRVGDGHLVAKRVGGHRDHLQLHLLVAGAVLASQFIVRHRNPVGDRRPQPIDHQAAAHALFELGAVQRRVLAAEQLLVARLADEPAVLLQSGNGEDLLRQLVVADLDALALGFHDRHFLVDHLGQNLLIDVQLPQQLVVHRPAELRPIRLHLGGVALLEFAGREWAAVHLRDHLACRRAHRHRVLLQEIGDVEDDKRQHHQAQAPFEPVPVPAHPVQHGHECVPSLEPPIVRHRLAAGNHRPRCRESHGAVRGCTPRRARERPRCRAIFNEYRRT